MKVCIVLSDLTFPATEGLHQQSVLMVQALREQGVDVDVYAYCKNPALLDRQLLWQQFGIELAGTLVECSGSSLLTGLRKRVALQRGRGPLQDFAATVDPDVYDVFHLEGAAACGLFRYESAHRTVLSWIDPGSRRNFLFAFQGVGFLRKLKHVLAAMAFLVLEASTRSKQTVWHLVSDVDRKYAKRVYGMVCAPIPVIHTGVSGELKTSDAPGSPLVKIEGKRKVVVFADLRRPHLMRAFVRFLDTVLPHLRRAAECDFVVLGRVDVGAISATNRILPENFRVIRWVDDYLAVLREADMILLPDILGTGLKNRAVQSLAAGAVVLGTPTALEGIPVVHGKHALVGELGNDWVQLFDLGLSDESLRHKLQSCAPEAVNSMTAERVARQWISLYGQIATLQKAHLAPASPYKNGKQDCSQSAYLRRGDRSGDLGDPRGHFSAGRDREITSG